jgi:hypothetical protein
MITPYFQQRICHAYRKSTHSKVKLYSRPNGLTNIYKTFHLKTEEYKFFSTAHGIFSMIEHMAGHEISLNIFFKLEIIVSIFPDYSAIKIKFNNKKTFGNFTKMLKLNAIFLNNQCINK